MFVVHLFEYNSDCMYSQMVGATHGFALLSLARERRVIDLMNEAALYGVCHRNTEICLIMHNTQTCTYNW